MLFNIGINRKWLRSLQRLHAIAAKTENQRVKAEIEWELEITNALLTALEMQCAGLVAEEDEGER